MVAASILLPPIGVCRTPNVTTALPAVNVAGPVLLYAVPYGLPLR